MYALPVHMCILSHTHTWMVAYCFTMSVVWQGSPKSIVSEYQYSVNKVIQHMTSFRTEFHAYFVKINALFNHGNTVTAMDLSCGTNEEIRRQPLVYCV